MEGIFHCMTGSKNVQAGTFTNIKIDMSSSTLRTEGEMLKLESTGGGLRHISTGHRRGMFLTLNIKLLNLFR